MISQGTSLEVFFDEDKNQYTIDTEVKPIGSGGEGTVYDIVGQSSSTQYVIKVFNKPENVDIERLKFFIEYKTPKLMNNKFAVPLKILYSYSGDIKGFLMVKIPHATHLYSLIKDFPSQKAMRWKYFDIDQKNYFRNRVALFVDLAKRLNSCEQAGIFLSDLKPPNVMVRAGTYDMHIIDIESAQLKDDNGNIIFRARVGDAEFTPPEYQGIESSKIDIDYSWGSFGFGCMLYKFLIGLHPYSGFSHKDPSIHHVGILIKNNIFVHGRNKGLIESFEDKHNNFHKLPACADELKKLFFRCFDSTNPQERPTYEEWIRVLEPLSNLDCVKSNTTPNNLLQKKSKNYNLLRQNQTYAKLESSKGLITIECIDLEILVEGTPLCIGKQCYVHWAVDEYESIKLEPYGEKVDFEGNFVTTIYETTKFILKGKKKNKIFYFPIDSIEVSVLKYDNPKTLKLEYLGKSNYSTIIELESNIKNINETKQITLKNIDLKNQLIDLSKFHIKKYEVEKFMYKYVVLNKSDVVLQFDEQNLNKKGEFR